MSVGIQRNTWRTAKGQVYFVEAVGAKRIKIGWTQVALSERVNVLRTCSPFELSLLGGHPGKLRDERALHQRFAAHRAFGEWFHDCPEIRSYIAENARVIE